MLAGEGLGRRDELLEGELLVHRHDLVADLVRRAVEADGEAEAQRLLGELEDLGHDAGSRYRHPPGPEAETPGGVDDTQGGEQVVVVGQGLAHAHDHDVIERGQPFGGAGGVGLVLDTADLDELGDDLPDRKVALPALQAGGAELAAIGAADLGRDADGPAGLLLADALHRGADDHGLDQGAVAEALEDLLGDVGGGLALDQGRALEVVLLGKPGPETGRQIGHRLGGFGPPGVEPLEDLSGPITRVAGRDQSLAEGVGRFTVD